MSEQRSEDELSMYFRENSGPIDDAVADESDEADEPDTSEDAPEEEKSKPDKKRNIEEDDDLDEDDSDDEDDDDESDDGEDEEDSGDIGKLKKQNENLETYRRSLQSENDTLKAKLGKLEEKLDSLIETNKKQAEQSEFAELFTGEDDALMTEGQVKQLIARANKKQPGHQQQQPGIGTDAEAQRIWADSQSDIVEVSNFFAENKSTLEPELATIPSIDGRYLRIRNAKMENELKSTKKALRKMKNKLKRMEKGELPETASGKRSNPRKRYNAEDSGDALTNFFRA